MPHMVIFRSSEGKPGYHQAETLDEAVRFVEHLRNQEQVTDTRIFRMQEVPIEFKTYVRVEVAPAVGEGEAPVAAAPAPGPVATPAPAASVVAPAPAPAAPVPAPAAAPVAAAPVEEPVRMAVDKGDKQDDVVVDPVPVGQGSGGSGRFGRFNRG
jgi:hypothetical protein